MTSKPTTAPNPCSPLTLPVSYGMPTNYFSPGCPGNVRSWHGIRTTAAFNLSTCLISLTTSGASSHFHIQFIIMQDPPQMTVHCVTSPLVAVAVVLVVEVVTVIMLLLQRQSPEHSQSSRALTIPSKMMPQVL